MSVTDLSGDLSTELVGNTVFDYGDQALMVQCGSTAEVLAWVDALRGAAFPGVVDIVPAARTVLIKLDNPRWQGSPASGCARCASAPTPVPRRSAAPTW